jgi:glycerol kinase
MSKYIAAIDQGTTSTRCILFDHSGNVCYSAQKEHRQIFPQPGWVEHDPVEIWRCTQLVIREVLEKGKIKKGEIFAVGITNQRETTVIWDRHTGQPYYNAIVWQDTRTKQICDELSMDVGIDRFRSITGLPLATYFSGPKIKWLIDNIPYLHHAINQGNVLAGNIDSWLIWWLTGGPKTGLHVTDGSNASRTILMDLESITWKDEILKALNIPLNILPNIIPSSDPHLFG